MDYLSFSASRRRRPRAARSRSALKVQYLGAKNALLDNLSLFFLEEREPKREIKILINYTNIFKRKTSRTFLKPIIGFQEHHEKKSSKVEI